VRSDTLAGRRRLYLLARLVVARHYRRQLTLPQVARALASSPRQLQRAYAQFGETSFREDLQARRMDVAAALLVEQRSIPVCDVARLVGYSQAAHFARVFRRRYGVPPAVFRERAIAARAATRNGGGPASEPAGEATRAPRV
jgi:AraC family transcriptional regulator, regulatory protein of adaptative response / methylphosphotriester-DNA alkyltransferase methyltransferase